jgi:hypothetical protein
MKKIIAVLLALFMVLNLAGCDALQRKFTRKKKETVKMPRIYQVKKYEKKPTIELYEKHYVYWVTFQSEILENLGESHKKDVVCIEHIVSNLKDMQAMLVKEKSDQLAPHIERLVRLKDSIEKEEMGHGNKTYAAATLEREDRFIKREFSPKKVRKFLKKSFEETSGADAKAVEAVPETEKGGPAQ